MTHHYMFGILVLLASLLLQVSTLPTNNESTTSVEDLTEAPEEKDERALKYDETNVENEDASKEIIKKISAINDALRKPNRRHPVQWSAQPQTGGGYVLDKEILEKLQQVIASGNLHAYPNKVKQQETNAINNENLDDIRYSRQISPLYGSNHMAMTSPSMAYMTSIPVLVMPSTNNINSHGNSLDYSPQYQTREGLFGQFPWPFAPLFPILIRDPVLSGFQNFLEVGQSADVCRRKQKSDSHVDNENEDLVKAANLLLTSAVKEHSRRKRAVKKRTVSLENQLQDTNKANKFIFTKPTTAKPSKPEATLYTKTIGESDGDLRFPFLFGHKEKPPTGPGLFINRLKVRQGGVAIAGPGGVATAGRGGTAIVGPGGLAYTQPGGIAVAGPAARVIALSADADLTSVANRLHQQSTIDGSVSQLIQAIPEGKHVATGPVIYFHPNKQFYRGATWKRDGKRSGFEYRKQSDTYRYNGMNFQEGPLRMDNATFTLYVKPMAYAKSFKGTAIANPISQVIIRKHQIGTIVHKPLATAIAGPGGIAHAQSDLYLYDGAVQYLPYYGGAKGQYLEIKKDISGKITSEKIVTEENISSENMVKNSDGTLLAKVMAKNLQNLKTLSSSLLKLTNLGRKTGYLSSSDKARYITQLTSLGEAASNIVKLVDEIDDVDVLFKKNVTSRKVDNNDEDYVSEEGVGIEASNDDFGTGEGLLEQGTIAEAKPVGLAVIGENGLAASRPHATAVAAHGVAIARPIATAVAGIDPTLLGISFQVHNANSKH